MTPFSPARDDVADLLRRRIVVAPMAGGPTTTELVVAAGVIRALQDAGSAVVITVTSTAEAALAEQAGADALKAVLADPRYTATTVTRAFSRRPARGLVNEFIVEHADAPPACPELNNATGRCAPPPRPAGTPSGCRCGPGRATAWPPSCPPPRSSSGCAGSSSGASGHTRGGREVDGSWENGGRLVKAVRFDEYGDIDVLKVVDVPTPVPGPGQVLVQVKAAGINPGEAKIREGLLHSRWPATFPSGQGSDLAGVVAATGAGVTGFATGDEVIGYTDSRASQAECVVVEERNLTAKPAGVPWEVAGALNVVGATAYAAVRAVALTKGDTVVVSSAAGGVGSLAVQLAGRVGATVIGLASPANHDWLAGHGVIPVAYGDGVADRIRQAAGTVDAFIDTFGADYVRLALELGVEPSRIDTIADFEAVAKYGVKADGNAAGASASTLADLTALIADGQLEVPIAATYPLGQVQEAYRRLASGHIRGKIVLTF